MMASVVVPATIVNVPNATNAYLHYSGSLVNAQTEPLHTQVERSVRKLEAQMLTLDVLEEGLKDMAPQAVPCSKAGREALRNF
jgi:hypothetical protein